MKILHYINHVHLLCFVFCRNMRNNIFSNVGNDGYSDEQKERIFASRRISSMYDPQGKPESFIRNSRGNSYKQQNIPEGLRSIFADNIYKLNNPLYRRMLYDVSINFLL